ncbi:hypothetical protein GSB9_02304 [Flavobacteriaceae bacterium GSB9]|nr:hypothetical protein GSB9_02304 [Flavobacteriaceae bacterium GSB9]
MKKDIEITRVEGVYIAVINEYNDVYKTQDWNAYITNDWGVDLDVLLIVTNGYSGNKITSTFRKNTINLKALQALPLMQLKGVLVK